MDYTKKPPTEYVDPRDYQAEQVREFLKRISQIESSGGKNLNHPLVKTGMHSGTNAVGEYALMPVTAKDLDRQFKTNQLQDLDKFEAQDALEANPELTNRLAESLASKLLNKMPDDEAAFRWKYGQYNQKTPEELDKNERVKKFRVLKKNEK